MYEYVCRSDKNKKQIYFNYQQTICDKNWRADVSQHPDSTLCSRDRTSATSSPLTSCTKTCSVISTLRAGVQKSKRKHHRVYHGSCVFDSSDILPRRVTLRTLSRMV